MSVSDGHTSPVVGALAADQVRSLLDLERRLKEALPTVIVPGRDRALVEAERDVGRALGNLLRCSMSVLGRAAAILAQGADPDGLPTVVLDLDGEAARALPWELLGWGEEGLHLEAQRVGAVARRRPGPRAQNLRPGTAMRVLCWAPDVQEPTVAAVLAHHRELWRRLGLEPVLLSGDALPAPLEHVAEVLHVICHARAVAGRVELLSADGERAPGTLVHALSSLRRRARLVVLDACEAGGATGDPLDSPVDALLAAGFAAVLAPRNQSDRRAAERFSAGLYEALRGGQTLISATAAGRAAVVDSRVPALDARWYNYRLTVADDQVLHAGLMVPGWLPAGWPAPSEGAGLVLERARERAAALGVGYVGVEHVLWSLREVRLRGPMLRALLATLGEAPDTALERLIPLAHVREGVVSEEGSPRLRAYGPSLRPGFDVEALASVLRGDARGPFQQLLGLGGALGTLGVPVGTVGSTVELSADPILPEAEPPAAATGFEVVGGPHDGLRLLPLPGQVLGRWDPTTDRQSEIVLYSRTLVTDAKLSRQHLRFEEEGVVVPLRGAVLRAHGADTSLAPKVPRKLHVGDLIRIGGATWLLAI